MQIVSWLQVHALVPWALIAGPWIWKGTGLVETDLQVDPDLLEHNVQCALRVFELPVRIAISLALTSLACNLLYCAGAECQSHGRLQGVARSIIREHLPSTVRGVSWPPGDPHVLSQEGVVLARMEPGGLKPPSDTPVMPPFSNPAPKGTGRACPCSWPCWPQGR